MSLNEEKNNPMAAEAAEEKETQNTEAAEPRTEPSREQQLEAELAAMDDRCKRVLAEYQNFRTRSQKERESMYLDNVAATVAGFLPVADTLERALAQETDEGFKKSIEMILKQFGDSLERFQVKPFGVRGEAFDPNLHNAVMMTQDDGVESGQIAEVLQRGYILGDRVVRHAVVRVAE